MTGELGLVDTSPVNVVLVICLESSALIVVITVIFVVMSNDVSTPYMLISMQLLVHVYVSLQASCRLSKKMKLIQLRSCHHFLSFSMSYGAGH